MTTQVRVGLLSKVILMFVIEDELKKLPTRPGVYLMHDSDDTIYMSVRP